MRARQLEARARRGRMLATALVLVLVGAVVGVVGVVAATRDNNPEISVTNHGTSTTIAPTSSTKPGVVATSTTTTTTTTPAAGRSDAVSASFVSPTHGWVLRRNGTIVETSDGGSTWHPVGNVGPPTNFVRLRFADALHGFAFTGDVNVDTQRFVETTDGGAHWQRFAAPFSSISDLAISRGVIYVVGISANTTPNGAFPGFRIWSSPVDLLRWSVDPLRIPAGGGPVPEQQLVFSGAKGWMVNNDREVQSGARLVPATGRWTTWTPPCVDVGGPAALTASTSTDLVAICAPGPASSSTTTYIEFSHDGGTTFHRQTVPGARYGARAPLSPNANTAVVVSDGTVRRTTDEGASWQVVASEGQDAVDFGFTTPTQGFIIFGDGAMLMTYDAGATWSAVTLP